MMLKAEKPVCVIVFAAGRGGNPEAHRPLLQSLVDCGCTVVAPYFEIMSPLPSAEDLIARAEALRNSLKLVDDSNLSVVGVGHSIGASLLVALAGGQMWTKSGVEVVIPREERLHKLALFAPPTGFFQAPGALEKVNTPIQLWVGGLDTITPPSQVEFLKNSLSNRVSIDFNLVEGASHFSFMNRLPPTVVDQMPNRQEFLNSLASAVCAFTAK